MLFKSGEKSLLKPLWEKEKELVTSIFSFSQNIFHSSKNRFQFLSQIYILLSADAFSLDQTTILSFGKELSMMHHTN